MLAVPLGRRRPRFPSPVSIPNRVRQSWTGDWKCALWQTRHHHTARPFRTHGGVHWPTLPFQTRGQQRDCDLNPIHGATGVIARSTNCTWRWTSERATTLQLTLSGAACPCSTRSLAQTCPRRSPHWILWPLNRWNCNLTAVALKSTASACGPIRASSSLARHGRERYSANWTASIQSATRRHSDGIGDAAIRRKYVPYIEDAEHAERYGRWFTLRIRLFNPCYPAFQSSSLDRRTWLEKLHAHERIHAYLGPGCTEGGGNQ